MVYLNQLFHCVCKPFSINVVILIICNYNIYFYLVILAFQMYVVECCYKEELKSLSVKMVKNYEIEKMQF